MYRLRMLVLGLVLALLPLSGYAGDGDKADQKKADKAAKEEKEKAKEKDKKKDEKSAQGGNVFTRFWVHTVGGNIGGGLKSGANKIAKAFD